MELCPLLFCHNLPINVIYQILASQSCSTNSVFLRRDTRGCCSFSCVLHCGNWCCHSRSNCDPSEKWFLMASSSRIIGPVNQIVNECLSSQCCISSMTSTTYNVSIMWCSGCCRNVTLYLSRIHANLKKTEAKWMDATTMVSNNYLPRQWHQNVGHSICKLIKSNIHNVQYKLPTQESIFVAKIILHCLCLNTKQLILLNKLSYLPIHPNSSHD